MPEQYNARPASRELGNAIALGIGVKGSLICKFIRTLRFRYRTQSDMYG